MSSPKPTPATPLRATRFKPATPSSSAATRAQCSDDPADFALIKIHTAKCSICDKRNATDEMRRCKGCTWQICRPCQSSREQKGRTLAHGNSMTVTPSAVTARRRILHPIGLLAQGKDPEAETALAKVKEEEAEEALAAQQMVISPSTSQRTKHHRKVKKNKSLAEIAVDCDDDDDDKGEVQVRDQLSPFGGAGSKRCLSFKDTNEASPNKRACVERPERMKAPTPLPAEWTMSPQEKANLQNKTYANFADASGIRPSEHPTIMKDKFGTHIVPGPAQGQSFQYPSMPTPHSRPMQIPMTMPRNGKPRKSGDELVQEIQEKVRAKLHHRFGWPLEVPATSAAPPTELPAREPEDGTLRDFVDKEVRNLHHNLILDEDQQNELVAAMEGAARKFGHDVFKSMSTGFRAVAKPGLDLALEHLTHVQKQRVNGLIQTQAGHKLMEFEVKGTRFSGCAQGADGPKNV